MTEQVFTIVMPIYNGEHYIMNAVDDLVCQTYPFFELICVDDGSTDNTVKHLTDRANSDSRIKVLKSNHIGAAQARNIGINHARGEYLLFLDCDDRFEKQMLEKFITCIRNREIDILLFDASRFDSVTGSELTSDQIIRKDRLPAKEIFSYKDCAQDIFSLSISVVWNKLYRTEFIKENGFLFQDVPYLNDMYFNHLTLVKAERILFLNQKLIRYRQNRPGALSDAGNRQRDPLCAYRVALEIKRALEYLGIYQEVQYSYFVSMASQIMWTLEVLKGEAYFQLYDVAKRFLTENNMSKGFCEGDAWIGENLTFMEQMEAVDYLFFIFGKYKKLTEVLTQDVARLSQKSNELTRYKKWVFDSKRLKYGNRVILYGAGDMGTDYFEQFKRESNIRVVAWVDKYHTEISGKEMEIEAPESIKEKDFDYVIIAILNRKMVNEVREYLETMVIPEKIIDSVVDIA